jgi:hypothetical protein
MRYLARETRRWLPLFSAIAFCAAACSRPQPANDEQGPKTAAASSSSGTTAAASSSSTEGSRAPAAAAVPSATQPDAAASPQPAVPTEPGSLRLVLVHSHELSRREKMELSQMRAELERPGKRPIKLTVEPPTEDERRFIDEYLAAVEQDAFAPKPLPAAWLRSETVVALPIHPPIALDSIKSPAGYRDLLIFHPPAAQAVYVSHYHNERPYGPGIGVGLGGWIKKHLQVRAEEVGP